MKTKYYTCENCGKTKEVTTADVVPREEFDNLQYTLWGVMHSVDKWLDGDELKQHEVDRAATMREKTLRIIENLRTEVAKEIFDEIEKTLNRKIRRSEPEYERLNESFEKLSESGHSQYGYFKGIISTCEDLQDLIDELKKEIYGG